MGFCHKPQTTLYTGLLYRELTCTNTPASILHCVGSGIPIDSHLSCPVNTVEGWYYVPSLL